MKVIIPEARRDPVAGLEKGVPQRGAPGCHVAYLSTHVRFTADAGGCRSCDRQGVAGSFIDKCHHALRSHEAKARGVGLLGKRSDEIVTLADSSRKRGEKA